MFVLTLLKVAQLHGCFSLLLSCTNGTNLCKESHIVTPAGNVLVSLILSLNTFSINPFHATGLLL